MWAMFGTHGANLIRHRILKNSLELIHEIANLGPALLKLRHVRTCHINSKGNAGAGPIYNFNDTDDLRTGKLTQVTGTTDHIMIGFFRDQSDQEYFMVVNKHNARDPHSDERNLLHKITLTFADEVKAIEKLSRFTGHVEHLNLRDHQLSFFLPGGTGDLFKYATSMPFAGIER